MLYKHEINVNTVVILTLQTRWF